MALWRHFLLLHGVKLEFEIAYKIVLFAPLSAVEKRCLKYFANNKIIPKFERFLRIRLLLESNHLIDYINELLLIFKKRFLI